jgi:tRNA(Met) C34 N-acetyltransferase TmcA
VLDGETVGELDFADYAGTTQISRIAVAPAHQREGIATGMVATLREYLPGSVPAQFLMNLDARAFHAAVIERYKRPTV